MNQVALVIVDVVESFGWFVPYKSDVVGYLEEISFMAVFAPMGQVEKTIYISVVDGMLRASCDKGKGYKYSLNQPNYFECVLGDPDCFEKFGMGLKALWG